MASGSASKISSTTLVMASFCLGLYCSLSPLLEPAKKFKLWRAGQSPINANTTFFEVVATDDPALKESASSTNAWKNKFEARKLIDQKNGLISLCLEYFQMKITSVAMSA